MHFVPLVIVVSLGIVVYGTRPVSRMKGHSVVRLDFVNGQPPVDLAEGRGIPSIAMRMPGISDARSEISIAGRCSHPRHIKVGLVEIATEIAQDALNAP